MTQEIAKIDEISEESVKFFDLVTRQGIKPVEIANSTGYSLKTIYNRINRGREIVNEEIRKNKPQILADLWNKYEYLWEQADTEWKASKDPAFLKQMQSVLEAYRKMLAVDDAPKAPVNEKGETVQNTMVLVFSEDAYAKKEAELIELEKEEKEKAIDGTFTVTETSTKVPLSNDENGL